MDFQTWGTQRLNYHVECGASMWIFQSPCWASMQIFQSPVCGLDSFRCVELQHERFSQDHILSEDGGPFAISWFSAFMFQVLCVGCGSFCNPIWSQCTMRSFGVNVTANYGSYGSGGSDGSNQSSGSLGSQYFHRKAEHQENSPDILGQRPLAFN